MDNLGSFLAASVAASQLALEQQRMPFDYWPPLEPYSPVAQFQSQQLGAQYTAGRGSPYKDEERCPTKSQILEALSEHMSEVVDSSTAFSWFLNNELPRAVVEKVLCFSIPKEARFPPPKDDRTGGYGVLFRRLGFSQPEVAQRKWHRWRASIGYPWEDFRAVLNELNISFPPTLPPRKPGEGGEAPRPRGRPPLHKNKEKKAAAAAAAAAAMRAMPAEPEFDMYAPDRSLRPRTAGLSFDGLDSEGEEDALIDASHAGQAEARGQGGSGRKRTAAANPAAYRKQGPPIEGSPRHMGADVPQDVIQHYLGYLKTRAEALAADPNTKPHEEAYCLVCKDAECELKCDFPGCTKVFHVDCLVPEARPSRLESGDYDLDSNWYCPRHKCGHCSKIEELNRCDACLWCFCKRHGAQPQDQVLPGSTFMRKMCARCRNLLMGYPVDDDPPHQRSRSKAHPGIPIPPGVGGKPHSPLGGSQGAGPAIPELVGSPAAPGPRPPSIRKHDLTIRVGSAGNRSYSPSPGSPHRLHNHGRGRGRGGRGGGYRRGSGHTASASESDETETDVDLDSDEEAAFPAPGAVTGGRRSGGGVPIPVPRIRAFEEVAAASSPRDFAASPRTITVGAAVAALSVQSPRGRESPRALPAVPGHHHAMAGQQQQAACSPSSAKRKFEPRPEAGLAPQLAPAPAPVPATAPRPAPAPVRPPPPAVPLGPQSPSFAPLLKRPTREGDLPSAFLPPPSGAAAPLQSLSECHVEGEDMGTDSPPPQTSTAGSSSMATPLTGGNPPPSGATGLPPLLSSARQHAAAQGAHQQVRSPESTVIGDQSEDYGSAAAAEEAAKEREHFVGMLDWAKRLAADAVKDGAARAALTRCIMLNMPQIQAVYRLSLANSRRVPALAAALVDVAVARNFALPPASVAQPDAVASCLAWVESLAERHPGTVGEPKGLARLREHVFLHTPQIYALHAVRARQPDNGAEALAILAELPLPSSAAACEGPRLCARCRGALEESAKDDGEDGAVDIEGQAPMDDS